MSLAPTSLRKMDAILSCRYPLLQSLCLLYPARYTVDQTALAIRTAALSLDQTTEAIQTSDRTTERLSWGFVPFSVSSARSPLDPGLPHPARSALEVSHLLSGFLLPTPPEFISPRNAPGIHPSELSPPKEPYASRRPYPLAVLPLRPNPWLRTPTLLNPGFNSAARNDFRVLLSPGARSHRRRV